jgi:fused signal recognition particle receptor
MVFSIRQQLGIPVLFAGLGEKIEDMATFNPDEFVEGILAA